MDIQLFKRIDHIALHVKDLKKSINFYTSNFNFSLYSETTIPSGTQIAYLKLGDTILELAGDSNGDMSGFHFCLETNHFDEAIQYLSNRKIIFLTTPHEANPRTLEEKGWRRALFIGPDNERIEIRG